MLCISASEARKFIKVASDVIGLNNSAFITLEYITLSEADIADDTFTGKSVIYLLFVREWFCDSCLV